MPARRSRWLMPFLGLILLVGCYPIIPRVVRIGLVAPFEGRYREIGYALIPAVRLAIREWAVEHPDAPVAIELVAYDDGGDPEMAVGQARKLAVDPDVLVVIGHWRDDTTQAALPIYQEAGLPLIVYSAADVGGEYTVNLSPSLAGLEALADTVDAASMLDSPDDITAAAETLREAPDGPVVGGPLWGMNQFYALAGSAAEGVYFVTGAALPSDLGIEDDAVFAHPLAPLGYDAALVALAAIHAAGAPSREAVAAALPSVQMEGQTGTISFDVSRRRADAPAYLYIWREEQPRLVGGHDE
jgi:ABC-type branched-subunit amino acid transport system substrate-binding protein